MNTSDLTTLFTATIKSMEGLLHSKGGEYAGSDDRLANFKRGAQLTGVTPLQCAFIYASKHYDAIATYVRDEAHGETRPRSESIEGRLNDLMNYCFLMKAIIEEEKRLKPPHTTDPRKEGPYALSSEGGRLEIRSPQLYDKGY